MAQQETTDVAGVAGVATGAPDETTSVSRHLTSATLAQNFEVTTAGQGGDIPGTFTVASFDGFTAMFRPTGAHGGTFTVEHQLRAAPGGPWTTDGVDGSIATDLVATINHKAFQYRPSIGQNHGAGPATLSVEGVGS